MTWGSTWALALWATSARAQPAPSEAQPVVASEAQPAAEGAPSPKLDKLDTASGQRFEDRSTTVQRLERELAKQAAALAALQEQASAESAAAAETFDSSAFAEAFRLYGFSDMGFQKIWWANDIVAAQLGATRASTFVLGNLNLYFDAAPLPEWRALTEVRLTTYPDGDPISLADPFGGRYDRTSSQVFDQNSAAGPWNRVSTGAIVLERAHIDWLGFNWLSVRTGLWLTPYGIWNVDHGSPTLIPLMQPQFILQQFFPERQLGVQAFGAVYSGEWQFGYAAYISNGRLHGQHDWSEGKMLGGRLQAQVTTPYPLTLGVSGFSGKDTDIERRITGFSPFAVEELTTISADEWGLAGDVSVDVGDLRLRTEFVLDAKDYQSGKRPVVWDVPGTGDPDGFRWSTYALAAYRLPWFGLEPYVFLDLTAIPSPEGQGVSGSSAGLNVHLSSSATFKAQYAEAHFLDFADRGHSHDKAGNRLLSTRLVLAF